MMEDRGCVVVGGELIGKALTLMGQRSVLLCHNIYLLYITDRSKK